MEMNSSYTSHLIFVTAAFVLLFGGITCTTLHPPLPLSIKNRDIREEDRHPASLIAIGNNSHPSLSHKAADTIDLRCLTNGLLPEIETQARQVRLVGQLCPTTELSGSDLGTPEIVNQTNGFLATVFTPQEYHFTSDYIYLAAGKNQVLITWEPPGGTKIHSQLALVRRSLNNSKPSPQ